MAERELAGRRVLLLRGASAVAFGMTMLLWSAATVRTLALLFGMYALANGAGILAGVHRWPGDGASRKARTLLGLVCFAAGVGVVAWPDITAAGLAGLVGAAALGTGAVDAWFTARRRARWTAPLVGLASIVSGVAVLVLSHTGGHAVAVVIGVYAVLTGVLLLVEVRRRQQSPYRRGHRPMPTGG